MLVWLLIYVVSCCTSDLFSLIERLLRFLVWYWWLLGGGSNLHSLYTNLHDMGIFILIYHSQPEGFMPLVKIRDLTRLESLISSFGMVWVSMSHNDSLWLCSFQIRIWLIVTHYDSSWFSLTCFGLDWTCNMKRHEKKKNCDQASWLDGNFGSILNKIRVMWSWLYRCGNILT